MNKAVTENQLHPAKRCWYVLQVYSSMEKSVQRTLQERIAQSDLKERFGRVLVPTEEVVEVKDGREHVSERRFYPGYVLIEMEMDDQTWHFVNDTKGVMGFVGGARKGASGSARKAMMSGARPSPIPQREVDEILAQMQGGLGPRPKTLFKVGEMVRIKSEPFTDFNGSVEEVNYEKSRLRVFVMIFGRATPVELEFGQVEKLSEFN
jgi:transcriptional antiterminator NusG